MDDKQSAFLESFQQIESTSNKNTTLLRRAKYQVIAEALQRVTNGEKCEGEVYNWSRRYEVKVVAGTITLFRLGGKQLVTSEDIFSILQVMVEEM